VSLNKHQFYYIECSLRVEAFPRSHDDKRAVIEEFVAAMIQAEI
jgi:hypothetical protein